MKLELDKETAYAWLLGCVIVATLFFAYGFYLSYHHGGVVHIQSKEMDERKFVSEPRERSTRDKLHTDPYDYW